MRIVSLVPHATELLFALGLGDQVVAVTHECDYPTAAQDLPTVTRDKLAREGLSAREIDTAVRASTQDGDAIYELDEEALHEFEPDLIVTQGLCPVCAVDVEEVEALAQTISSCPRVIALDPTTYGETQADIRTIAQATGTKDAAVDLIARNAGRVDRVRIAVKDAEPLRVAAIEWFDPVFIAGHWTPQLIEMAGGIDALGFAGEHSEQSTWEMVAAAEADVIVCMPCGYDLDRAEDEAMRYADALRETGVPRIVVVDGSAYFSRPGPRLVDGLELLGHILHPTLVPQPQTGAVARELELVTR
ncbi:MAG: cobalamin-binding protein [Solirubrobacteraceae bacterium]|nr:cobalamin-binding protein [Solirubrobacteraceae bacterium]